MSRDTYPKQTIERYEHGSFVWKGNGTKTFNKHYDSNGVYLYSNEQDAHGTVRLTYHPKDGDVTPMTAYQMTSLDPLS